MARRRLRWTLQAADELESIHDWIAKDDPVQAKRQVRLIYALVSKIPEFPESGRMVPEYGLPDFREKIHNAYRIVYWLRAKDIQILTIHGSSMPFPSLSALLRKNSPL